ncbi:MAG: hypothetical protein V3R91_09280 [Myxococcota bacterium]
MATSLATQTTMAATAAQPGRPIQFQSPTTTSPASATSGICSKT